jgi:KUP system potassium uptake protein
VQSRGTAAVAAWFGPITFIWFIALAAGGLAHLVDDPSILAALSPAYGVRFLLAHGHVGLVALGAVFLTVTGAEALYADMGHFGIVSGNPLRLLATRVDAVVAGGHQLEML